ncbi:hypothetical protein [Photobacterium kishitanii]|uniref:Uncharacterized protein n=1 Tax=Photobacterium kishitanii TaxID=318456 RepID=A0A2T3KML4_9GAMM|nr:hypothetical protein [Photobacterium kishitanii]PSV01040.1 hypothetical protein C9J27_03150 [Photobacterium kishitanii]
MNKNPYDVTSDYSYILEKIAKLKEVSISSIEIIDHPCGEDTIFVNGDYAGYIDDSLFRELDLLEKGKPLDL